MSSNQQSINDLLFRYQQLNVDNTLTGIGHAVGYIRVSTIMQSEQGSSMDSQRQFIEDYCKTKNYICDHIYEEPARSGADRNRSELKLMIESLRPGMVVVSYSIDRIARDTRNLLDITDQIHSKRCSLYIIDRQMDTSDHNQEFQIKILAAIADENRKSQNKNISAVMSDMSSKGTLRTKPPYGWTRINKELVPVESEQIVIGLIRSIIAEKSTISVAEICRRLDSMNIKIRNSPKVHHTVVSKIITNNHLR